MSGLLSALQIRDISFISVKLLTCNLQVFLIHNMITGHMTTEYLKIHFRAQSCTKIYVALFASICIVHAARTFLIIEEQKKY